jgi:hypothetical protein
MELIIAAVLIVLFHFFVSGYTFTSGVVILATGLILFALRIFTGHDPLFSEMTYRQKEKKTLQEAKEKKPSVPETK